MSFNRLEADDFVVSAQSQTQTCWTNNLPTLPGNKSLNMRVNLTTTDSKLSPIIDTQRR